MGERERQREELSVYELDLTSTSLALPTTHP